MREVDLGSGRALLIKQRGEFSAIGHKCPHYGAPLVKGQRLILRCRLNNPDPLKYQTACVFLLSGVLSKGHVRCPWHGACFNIATGDIEDFPGLDSLPTFQVTLSPVPCPLSYRASERLANLSVCSRSELKRTKSSFVQTSR